MIVKSEASIQEERNTNVEQLETKISEEQIKVKELIDGIETSDILLKKETKSK